MNDMVTFTDCAAQGDLLIRRIKALPEGVVPMAAERGQYVLGHSETGHFHVVPESQGVSAFQAANDPLLLYIVVKEPVALTHLRSFDTHRPIQIQPGTFEVRRQREWTPEGWRRAAD